ncbi:MAG TPA: hypothetical protein VIQ31_03270 [Phormidium sp.]
MDSNQNSQSKEYLYMKTLAAKALLALEEVCSAYDLTLEDYIKSVDREQLKAKMQELDSTLADHFKEAEEEEKKLPPGWQTPLSKHGVEGNYLGLSISLVPCGEDLFNFWINGKLVGKIKVDVESTTYPDILLDAIAQAKAIADRIIEKI